MTRPLVVEIESKAPKMWAVVKNGAGHVISEKDGTWWPMSEAPGLGGRVLTRSEEAALFARFGTPEAPRSMPVFDREASKLREEATKDLE